MAMMDGVEAASPEGVLTYPFSAIPEPGQPLQVAPGVYWVRMPLPFSLNHINLWLLEDEDGWTMVDTGIRAPQVRDVWETIFTNFLGAKPIRRIIVTHYHPDHSGLAGSFVRRFNAPLHMTRTEFLFVRMLYHDRWDAIPAEVLEFYRRAGFGDDRLALQRERKSAGFRGIVSEPPIGHVRLRDGDQLKIGNRSWQAVIGRGHAPEHLCLWSPADKLIISGDQILPRISSNVSVHATEPDADPLREWLESCARLRDLLDDQTLVLPAHNEPFYGACLRLQGLIDRHEANMVQLAAMCDTPKRVIDVFPALFKRPVGENDMMLATGESLAHLNCLAARGTLVRESDASGVLWFRRAPQH